MEAVGILEVVGVVAAMDSLDAMTKASNVSFKTMESRLGGRLVTVIVEGKVDDVESVIEVGFMHANRLTKCVAKAVIPRPHDEVKALIEKSGLKFTL